MADILFMNNNGEECIVGGPKLRCLDGVRLCPCGEVQEMGKCDQGVFKK